MRRPTAAREALRFSPLVQASGADASGVEGVPLIAAGAIPFVFLAGRPTAERATDARRLRGGLLLFLKLAVRHQRSSDSFRGHISHPMPTDIRRSALPRLVQY